MGAIIHAANRMGVGLHVPTSQSLQVHQPPVEGSVSFKVSSEWSGVVTLGNHLVPLSVGVRQCFIDVKQVLMCSALLNTKNGKRGVAHSRGFHLLV
jgi:hypothetical protein